MEEGRRERQARNDYVEIRIHFFLPLLSVFLTFLFLLTHSALMDLRTKAGDEVDTHDDHVVSRSTYSFISLPS